MDIPYKFIYNDTIYINFNFKNTLEECEYISDILSTNKYKKISIDSDLITKFIKDMLLYKMNGINELSIYIKEKVNLNYLPNTMTKIQTNLHQYLKYLPYTIISYYNNSICENVNYYTLIDYLPPNCITISIYSINNPIDLSVCCKYFNFIYYRKLNQISYFKSIYPNITVKINKDILIYI